MDINLTEEQAKTPVTYGDFAILLKEIMKVVAEGKETENKTTESILNALEVLAKRINEIEYNQIRDRKFFIRELCSDGYLTVTELTGFYNKWCEQFDKLNKEEQEDEASV